jgi:hypothetical protein
MRGRAVLVTLTVALWGLGSVPADAAPTFEATFVGTGVPVQTDLVWGWRFDGVAVTAAGESLTAQIEWSSTRGHPDLWYTAVRLFAPEGGSLHAYAYLPDPSAASQQLAGLDSDFVISFADGRFAALVGQPVHGNLRTTPWSSLGLEHTSTSLESTIAASGLPGRAMVATLSGA